MKELEIYGTLGPSCCEKEVISKLFKKGMTGMRLNLSHTSLKQASDWIHEFSLAAKENNIEADLLIDMQGPELRIGEIEKQLNVNDIVSIDDLAIPNDIKSYINPGQIVLFDDGKIKLEMIDANYLKVIQPGLLKSHKSIALPNITIERDTLTKQDKENIKDALEFGVTGLMQPFVRNVQDLMNVKKEIEDKNIKIYAKIENIQGLLQLDDLIDQCDQIVIARGDLANSVGIINLPSAQKYIEDHCKAKNRDYMVVTEMLHSMIKNPTPTRAEVSDIYHAVYNGAKSIMLTAETAMGSYPVEAMEVFVGVANSAVKDRKKGKSI
ncbi:MAG: pyruvate kinase [Erysipelotrichaceae bacterium]|uniref:pyruvate kinase n=1 Tax=Floccifex sp. TaxID=2815810 RepID=UPI002A763B90|nr:pyruvate kinase [Floccifex sp.]MDD7281735.1 pyruvate kinase [Erysipelotrichaceae bacterium]MDY2957567.1 pyruvate kinase [Floccifex sp.]